MKFSWKSLKISITGAKLTHLVQQNSIWDHGTMVETVKIVFNHVQKASNTGDMEGLKKYMSEPGYVRFKNQMEKLHITKKEWPVKDAVIKKIAILDVQPGRKSKPDMFCAIMNGYLKNDLQNLTEAVSDRIVVVKWSFIRQGDWWVLDEIRS